MGVKNPYERINWKDHVVEKPNTYRQVTNPDGTITQTAAPGETIQQGTPQSATNFNHMDKALFDHINDDRAPHDPHADDITLIEGGEGSMVTSKRTTGGIKIPARFEVLAKITEPEGGVSPETPGTIELVEQGTVRQRVRNWLDNTQPVEKTLGGITFVKQSDGRVLCNGTPTSRQQYVLMSSYEAPAGTRMTMTGGNSSIQMVASIYNGTTWVSDVALSSGQAVSFDMPVLLDGRTLRVYLIVSASLPVISNLLLSPMIEPGDTAHPYQPYTGKDIPLAYGRAIGGLPGYPDVVDLARGVLVLQSYPKIFDGTESWSGPYNAGNGYQQYNFADSAFPALVNNGDIVSTHFTKGDTGAHVAAPAIRISYESGSSTRLLVRSNIATLAEHKAWIAAEKTAGRPLIAIVQLATPLEIPLPAATIEAIKAFISNAGEMHVWSDGGGKTYVDRVTLADILGDVYDLRAELNELLAASGGA